VYAIAFDLDTEVAARMCGEGWRGICYGKINRTLAEFGFRNVQGSVYEGDDTVDATVCVIAVQELERRYEWFGRTVRSLKSYRIEESSDLMKALRQELRLRQGDAA
jgi:virulence-associated protein VapD